MKRSAGKAFNALDENKYPDSFISLRLITISGALL